MDIKIRLYYENRMLITSFTEENFNDDSKNKTDTVLSLNRVLFNKITYKPYIFKKNVKHFLYAVAPFSLNFSLGYKNQVLKE